MELAKGPARLRHTLLHHGLPLGSEASEGVRVALLGTSSHSVLARGKERSLGGRWKEWMEEGLLRLLLRVWVHFGLHVFQVLDDVGPVLL